MITTSDQISPIGKQGWWIITKEEWDLNPVMVPARCLDTRIVGCWLTGRSVEYLVAPIGGHRSHWVDNFNHRIKAESGLLSPEENK